MNDSKNEQNRIFTLGPRQLNPMDKLIAFLYISNSKCTGDKLWNSQTGFKLKKNTLDG